MVTYRIGNVPSASSACSGPFGPLPMRRLPLDHGRARPRAHRSGTLVVTAPTAVSVFATAFFAAAFFAAAFFAGPFFAAGTLLATAFFAAVTRLLAFFVVARPTLAARSVCSLMVLTTSLTLLR